MVPKHADTGPAAGMRLDKWLWCARFYKTRALAADAARNGRVLVNAIRVKPSRIIHPGARIRISRNPYRFDITVTALSGNRKSAADAALLYTESRESMEQRALLASQLKMNAITAPGTKGRPTKRERRALMDFRKLF